MSFLEELQKKRKLLKSCDTIVTTTTGERFREKAASKEIEKILSTENSYGFVVDTKPDLKPACILTNFLYLGSQDAVTMENIKEYQLTYILSIGIECSLQDLPITINLRYIPCLDLPETNLIKDGVITKSFKFIDEARLKNGRVLVHCNAGVSRSASVVLAYLMQYHNMGFETAYKHVKAQRECIQPNAGFLKQLKEFNFKLRESEI